MSIWQQYGIIPHTLYLRTHRLLFPGPFRRNKTQSYTENQISNENSKKFWRKSLQVSSLQVNIHSFKIHTLRSLRSQDDMSTFYLDKYNNSSIFHSLYFQVWQSMSADVQRYHTSRNIQVVLIISNKSRRSKLRPSMDHLAIVYLLLARPPLDLQSLCYQTKLLQLGDGRANNM